MTFGHDARVLVVGLACVVALSGCESSAGKEVADGDRFPLAALQALAREHDLDVELSGKTLIVNFWATWCGPCRKEMPSLQQLSNSLDKKNYLVVGVSVDEDENLMQEFLLQHGIEFANTRDADQWLTRELLGVEVFPVTFIVRPNGLVARRIEGERDWYSPAIRNLLSDLAAVWRIAPQPVSAG